MAKKCDEKDLYQSLEWCEGAMVLPGIRRKLYYINRSNIVQWPKLPETVTASIGELATYKGDFELAADKKWKFIDIIVKDSPVTSESQGEKPSVTSLNKATFRHAGTEEEATALCRLAANGDLVFLVQQKNGKFRVLGNDMFDVTVSPAQTLGAAAADTGVGTTLEVEVTDVCPAPFYPGKIETEDGDISGVDGGAVTT